MTTSSLRGGTFVASVRRRILVSRPGRSTDSSLRVGTFFFSRKFVKLPEPRLHFCVVDRPIPFKGRYFFSVFISPSPSRIVSWSLHHLVFVWMVLLCVSSPSHSIRHNPRLAVKYQRSRDAQLRPGLVNHAKIQTLLATSVDGLVTTCRPAPNMSPVNVGLLGVSTRVPRPSPC